jgi:hypothetical protein
MLPCLSGDELPERSTSTRAGTAPAHTMQTLLAGSSERLTSAVVHTMQTLLTGLSERLQDVAEAPGRTVGVLRR